MIHTSFDVIVMISCNVCWLSMNDSMWLDMNRELYTMMNQVANVLKSRGVVKGDRVAIYIPASPIAVASMLACARIGAIHSVVFAGFSAQALASRIIDGIQSFQSFYTFINIIL